jgi:hypothetical protein
MPRNVVDWPAIRSRRHCSKHAEAAECFTDLFIEPLFDYIDEQIDDRRTVLGLLLKYKHPVGWFRRDELRARSESDTLKGGKKLALDLYAYLHDQGLEFSIESADPLVILRSER